MKYRELTDEKLSYSTILDEGKTKIIRILHVMGGNDIIDDAVAMEFRDDITAGDGEKPDCITKKGEIDWKINSNIFKYLNRKWIRTHFIRDLEPKISMVEKLDKKINLEVVVRRVATGSILKHTSYPEGHVFLPSIVQLFYKDDFLHDPLLDMGFIRHLSRNKGCFLYNKIVSEAGVIFSILEDAFSEFKVQLVDMKVEFGLIDDQIVLIDGLTPSNFRLWPYVGDTLDCYEENVLDQLNPKGRLDKDIYKKGEGTLDDIRDNFIQVMEITDKFKEL